MNNSRPIKIAQVTLGRPRPDVANGVDRVVFYLSQALAEEGGHEVRLFSLTNKPACPVPGVAVKAYSLPKLPFKLPQPLLNDLLVWQPDVVHLHSVYTPVNTSLAHWLHRQGLPYVVTPHGGFGSHNEVRRRYFKLPYKLIFELNMLNNATFVHSIGDTEDIRAYGVNAPILTTSQALEPSLLPSDEKSYLVSRFPEVKDKLMFGFLGRLEPYQKGLDLLIKAFAKSRLEDALLLLIGPDDRGGKTKLEKLCSSLDVKSKVIFAGPAFGRDKTNLLAGLDVFVHPSRWEGGSLSVLEAAATGKPCLLTPSADPQGQLALHGGCISADLNVESIARGLRQFTSFSSEQRQAMGRRARKMVEEEFSIEKMASQLIEAYDKAIA